MARNHKVTLEVHQQVKEDVYHDRARIPELFRGCIREGRVCKITVGNESTLLEVRGIPEKEESASITPSIRIGELARRALGVEEKKPYAFCIREVWWIGQFWWAWNAADSASRIAARLGLLGLVLGVVGLLLGIVPLFKK